MNTRSNENRLGANPPVTEENSEPILETGTLKFITPTEFVELPSKGQFYTPDNPLHGQGVVEIKHMTAKEEDILTSVTLLKKGMALERMLENILVDKRIKVNDLLLGDKNALIIAARAHAYGTIYETSVNCPQCESTQEYSFDLDSLELQFPTEKRMEEHDVKKTEEGTFLVPLPKTQYTVEVKFLNGHDEKKVLRTQEHKKKRNFPETTVTDFLRFVIVSVNGIREPSPLNEFINTLPALHTRYIRKVYDDLIPSLDMKHPFGCSECGYEGTMEVPLTANFFWFNA